MGRCTGQECHSARCVSRKPRIKSETDEAIHSYDCIIRNPAITDCVPREVQCWTAPL